MLALKRITASLVAVSLSSQCVFADVAETSLWAGRARASGPLPAAQLQPLMPGLEKNLRAISDRVNPGLGTAPTVERVVEAVSSQWTTVRHVALPKDGKVRGVVIHFLDVHKNYEAQQNISSSLQSLFSAEGLSTVALEGAFSPIALEPYHKLPPAIRRSVADYLLSKNEISGPVHAAIVAAGSIPSFIGVDDKAAYKENLDAYLASTSGKEAVAAQLGSEIIALRKRKDAALNPELRAFDELAAGYAASDISLGRFVEGLASYETPGRPMPEILRNFSVALAAERAVDLPKVESQRNAFVAALTARMSKDELSGLLDIGMAFRSGRLGHGQFYERLNAAARRHDINSSDYPEFSKYLRYIELAGRIDPERLSAGLEGFQSRVYAALTKTDAERALVDSGIRLGLERKLIAFALTADEWSSYQSLREKDSAPRNPGLAPFEKFYASARIRDGRMAQNFVAGLHGNAAIVTGGFHSSGLESALNALGFAVVVVVPKLTHVDTADGAKYLTAFSREKTPLEQLLQGDKLFLADTPNRAMETGLAPVLVAATSAEAGDSLETAQGLPGQLDPDQFSGSGISLRRIAGGIQVMVSRGYRYVTIRVQYGKDFVIDTVASLPLRDSLLRRSLYVLLSAIGAEVILLALDQTAGLTLPLVVHLIVLQIVTFASTALSFFRPNRFRNLTLSQARDRLFAADTSLRDRRELISMIKTSGTPGNLQVLVAALEQHRHDALTLELVKAIAYLRTNGVLREKKIRQDSLFGAIWRAVDESGLDRDIFEMSAANDVVALNLKTPIRMNGALGRLVEQIRFDITQTGFRSGKEFRILSEIDAQGRVTRIALKVIITPATLTDLWRSLGTLDFKTDGEDLYRPFTRDELVSKLKERAEIFFRGLQVESEEWKSLRSYVYGDATGRFNPGLLEIVENPDATHDEYGRKVRNADTSIIRVESSEKIDRASRSRKRSLNTVTLSALERLAEGNPYFSHFIPENGVQRWVYLARAAGSVFTTAYIKGLMINRREQDHMFFVSEDTVGQSFWRDLHDELARNAGGVIQGDDPEDREEFTSVLNFKALQLHMMRYFRQAYYREIEIDVAGIKGFIRLRKNQIETDEAGVRYEDIYVYDRKGPGGKRVAIIQRTQDSYWDPKVTSAVRIDGDRREVVSPDQLGEINSKLFPMNSYREIPYVVNALFKQIQDAELLNGLKWTDENGNITEAGLAIIDEFGVGSYGFLFKFVVETRTRLDREEIGEEVLKQRLEAELGPGSWAWLSTESKTTDAAAIDRWQRAEDALNRLTRTAQSANVSLFVGRSTIRGENPPEGTPTMTKANFMRDYGIDAARATYLIKGGSVDAEHVPHPFRIDPKSGQMTPLYGPVPVAFETAEIRLGAYLKDLLLYNGVVNYHRSEYVRLGINALESVANDPQAPSSARRAARREIQKAAEARAAGQLPQAGIIPSVRDRFQGWFNRTLGRWAFPLIGAPLIEEIFGSRSSDERLVSYLIPIGYSMVPFLVGMALTLAGLDPILKHLVFWSVLSLYGVMFVQKHPAGARLAPAQIKIVSGALTAGAFLLFGFSPVALLISLGAAIVVHMGRNAPASRFDPAPLGEALIHAAAARAGGADWRTIFGAVDTLDIGRTLTDRNLAGPLSLRESKILAAYVGRRMIEEELSGRVSTRDAQQITGRLSAVIGVDVTVSNMDFVLVARAEDVGQAKALAAKYMAQGRRVRLIVDERDADVFRGLGTELKSYANLFDTDRRVVNLAVLDAALGTLSRADLQNSLLVASNQVSLSQPGYNIVPGSALTQIRYKALEEILTLLSDQTRVIPVSTLIEIARAVSVNA